MSFFTDEGARPLRAGRQAPAGCLLDAELARLLSGYKRNVAARYRSLAPEDIEQLLDGPMHVSPKVDGHMWFLLLQGGHPFLVNPAGRVIYGDIPVLVEARASAARAGEGRVVLAGELWATGSPGNRPRYDGVPEALGGEERAEVGRLGWFAFDVVEAKGRDGGAQTDPYAARLALLQSLVVADKRVRVIPTEEVRSHDAVRRFYDEWVGNGRAEGLVVRTRDGRIQKIKPTFTLDAAIVGYTERSDAPGQVRSLLLALVRPDGQLQLAGSCGNLGTDADRADLLALLAPTLCDADYRFAARSGELYRFVAPRHVVEVRVTDVQTENAAGREVARMVLRYEDGGGYRAVRPLPGVSLIHPVLVRRRVDKGVNPDDVRVAQVLERVEVPDVGAEAVAPRRAASDLLRREVFVKDGKGGRAVRKLLLWKTNKDQEDPDYPAFVVAFVDFSPGRKEPLQRDVRLAPTRAAADAIAAEMLADGVKRGWERVVPPA